MHHVVIMVGPGELTYLLSGMVEEHVMGPRTKDGVPVSLKELEDKGQARGMQAWRRCLTWEQAVKVDGHLRFLRGPVEHGSLLARHDVNLAQLQEWAACWFKPMQAGAVQMLAAFMASLSPQKRPLRPSVASFKEHLD